MIRFSIVGLLLALVLSGCTSYSHHPIDFGASDVVYVDKYVYCYGNARAYYEKVENRQEIGRLTTFWYQTAYYDDPELLNRKHWVGQDVTGYRVHLASGRIVEVSQVFLGPKRVVLAISGEPLRVSSWGSPDGIPDGPLVDITEVPKL